jgi:hypothetical protein
MDEHAITIDVFHFQLAHLGPAHTGRVDRHQHGAIKEIAGGVDQPNCFLLCQDDRQRANYPLATPTDIG